jgi:hypothetical protein
MSMRTRNQGKKVVKIDDKPEDDTKKPAKLDEKVEDGSQPLEP